jgi:broad specificity phosphatase PhoE
MAEGSSPAATKLVIVRHGQTAANTGRLLHGWTDLPLDDTGMEQARRVSARLAVEIHPDIILSSPLMRARMTAQTISDAFGIPVIERAELKEMHFGDLEGFTIQRLKEEHPDIAARALDPIDSTLVWPNGDDVPAFHRRITTTFYGIADEFAGQTAIVVSHNGVIGSYLSQLIGHPPNDWQSYKLTNCGISIVEVANGFGTILVRNDCTHLDRALTPFEGTTGR